MVKLWMTDYPLKDPPKGLSRRITCLDMNFRQFSPAAWRTGGDKLEVDPARSLL